MAIMNLVFVILMIHHIHGLDVVQNEIDGKVYTISMEKTTQSDAVKSCKNSGGKLYEPKDAKTYDKVVKFAERNGVTDFWLGIKVREGKSVYQSDNNPLGWKIFGYGHPKFECVFGKKKSSSSSYHMWYSQLCSSHEHYVCESCPSNLYIHSKNSLLEGTYTRISSTSSTFYWAQVDGPGTIKLNDYDIWVIEGGADFIKSSERIYCPNEAKKWEIWQNNSFISYNDLYINLLKPGNIY